ncbi:MAG: HAD-IIB family hydrolase [Planctomycetaceae bacterium]
MSRTMPGHRAGVSKDPAVTATLEDGHSDSLKPHLPLKITLISLHGLIRGTNPELGRDSDTGGQVRYVLELARELARQPEVQQVELLTRQIIDSSVSPDYAQIEEPLCDGAKIVRIPFGPRRYLPKERLWPYIEMFVDQTLAHFRRAGIPAVIHGHYADAGLAGAQLARLLHVPFVFTGHSLGRVKQQRLLAAGGDAENLEKRFHFRTRAEAEEVALETASMVITSTNQEVEGQYELYDHYQPGRMEVIPPGVSLSSFSPPDTHWQRPPIADRLDRFLRNSDRPMILAMARPDHRKNLEKLVEVYGQSERLRDAANLVLVMGARDDIRELPKAQRRVIDNVLHLIDRYDLYGSVAYPKTHTPQDAADLFRLATVTRGVFINPALTEPFGLTLLEAAATGLPVVATHDGGPQDIIANCRNGLLIDPLDGDAIERAVLRVLSEPDQWDAWSRAGIEGAHEHYSWHHHARRYLRDVGEIVAKAGRPALATSERTRRLPEFDRLIVTDLDNTLTGDPESLAELNEILRDRHDIGFGIATGRSLQSAMQLIEELGRPQPDIIDSDTGTQLHYGSSLTQDRSYQQQIGYAWKPDEVRAVLDEVEGLYLQEPECLSEFKVSYTIDSSVAPSVSRLRKRLRQAGVRAKVIHSLGMYLDIIPVRGGSDVSMRHLLWKWGFSPDNVLVAGDSGNDAGMLLGRTLGVVVGNHSRELNRLRRRPRIYFAKGHHARGVLEGIDYYQFLGNIVIPNDQLEPRPR